jgi:DNA replication and repair protein RecF
VISTLSISSLRNIISTKIHPSARVNIIYGANGSGKTSLLEAIFFLATARSFRATKAGTAIAYGKDKFTLVANLIATEMPISLGMEREIKGSTLMKLSGKVVTSISQLSQYLPVIVIDNQSFNLIDGSPSIRRKFINKGLFYHQPQFFKLWSKYSKILQQRNSLLKQRQHNNDLLAAWDQQLVELAEKIDDLSKNYLLEFSVIFKQTLSTLLNMPELEMSYYCGWPHKKSYTQCLQDSLAQDMLRGFTSYGPHRGDIHIHIGGIHAKDVLSRGQKKLFVAALMLAQGKFLQQNLGKQSVFLVDDLAAELDENNIQKLCNTLLDMDGQIFITAIEQDRYTGFLGDEQAIKYFAIDKGVVSVAGCQEKAHV